ADAPRPVLQHRLVLPLDRREAADPAADVDADHLRGRPFDGQPRVLQREVGRRHGELDETVHLLDVFLVHPDQPVEALPLAGEARRVLGGVEQRDGGRPGPALEQALPGGRGADAEGGHQAHSGDDDPSLLGHPYFLSLPCFSMYSTASLTRVIFSASSSGISIPNSSSRAITSSTVSRLSAPRSSTKEASGVTSSSSTPS